MPHWPEDRPPETGAAICEVWDAELYFRIPDHPQFNPANAYRAVAIEDFGPSTTAQIFFVNESGYLWAIPQNKCLCVAPKTWRRASKQELGFKLPETPPNSDWL